MKEVVTYKYIAVDGKEFDNEFECADYELKILYKESGFRFYQGETEFKKYSPDIVEIATRMTIDRSKEKENEAFANMYYDWGGASYVNDAFDKQIDANGFVDYGDLEVNGIEYIAVEDDKRKDCDDTVDFICTKQVNSCPICECVDTLYPYQTINSWGEKKYKWRCKPCKEKAKKMPVL